jgi:hypothetical protein
MKIFESTAFWLFVLLVGGGFLLKSYDQSEVSAKICRDVNSKRIVYIGFTRDPIPKVFEDGGLGECTDKKMVMRDFHAARRIVYRAGR